MAISDKLNYLIGTKQLFKDRLNSLGAEIIESTTFRNYLNWLDTFYNQVSDKTDLAKNGVVGRTSQDGDPTPENPVEINNLSGDVEYKVRGKNLFDKNNANVLNAYFAQEKVIASSSAGKTLYISCEPNTTYTVSRIVGTRFRILTTKTTPTLNVNGIDYQANDNATSLTITTSNNANYLCVYYYSSSSDTKTEQQILDSIMINEGSTPLPYEPHISESFPLSLGDIELCNISDYKDRIYSQNGKFYLEKNIGKVVLDGSETYRVFSNNRFRTQITNKARNGFDTIISICNILTATTQSSTVSTTQNNLIAVNEDYVWLRITSSTTEQEFKTLLQNTNAIVYYILANSTSTTTEITQENYPTLYSQLLAIQEFLTKYKINKEFLLDYSSPEIEY